MRINCVLCTHNCKPTDFYTHIYVYIHMCMCVYIPSGKSPAIVNIMRTVCMASMSPGSKDSGLECACVNNDDFTVLISGGGRCG